MLLQRHRGLKARFEDRWAARYEFVSYLPSTAPLSSVSISEFRSFAALIVASHQASLPSADMLSMFALMAEKKATSRHFHKGYPRLRATIRLQVHMPREECASRHSSVP